MADNDAGLLTIQEWADQLRGASGFVESSLPALGEMLVDVVRSNIAAQVSPDGAPWVPSKNGEKVLKNAGKAISVTTHKNMIVLKVSGHEVFHHYGTHRVPARPLLPTGGAPQKLGQAIGAGLVHMGEAFMSRSGRHDRGAKGVRSVPSSGSGGVR